MTWLDIFHNHYYEPLNSHGSHEKFARKRGLQDGLYRRGDGFRIMFEKLLALDRTEYHIIETGTLRNPGNWKDGQSAFLFTEFVIHQGGWVRSVDIDAAACNTAREAISSDRFSVTCSDSVTYLASLPDLDTVDLFYLDSWDVKWHNDHDSAEHHLREFIAIEPYLKPGTVVAIDDNARFLDSGLRTGKGRRVVEYLSDKGIQPIMDAYQIIYQWP
jgi:hypothetical protein